MILYVKGADFSSANIGTLGTFAVRKAIGVGATYDIPNSVTKNASVTWTITLADGYTFGNYSLTMGATTITPTVNGNVMTISISKVTGNININVVTVNNNVELYTFTIKPTPSDATVKLTGAGYIQEGNSISVPSGTNVSWTVSANGYISQSGEQIVTSTTSKTITLVAQSVVPDSTNVSFSNDDFEVGGIGADGVQLVTLDSRWRQKAQKSFNTAVTLTPSVLNGTASSTKLRVFTYDEKGSKLSDSDWKAEPIEIGANVLFKLTMQKHDGTAVAGKESITITVPAGATKLYLNTTIESKDYAYFTYNGVTHNGSEFTDKLYHYNNNGQYASINASSKMAGYPTAISVTPGDSVILSIFVSATLGYVFADDSGNVISDSTGVSMPQRTYQPLEYFTYA